MKKNVNSLLDWFENHFNFFIELLALFGGVFSILFSVALFIILLVDAEMIVDVTLGVIILPGVMGFAGVFILFALRITRFLTKNNNKKD